MSGLTKLTVGHPFDTIKLRMQCSPPGTYSGPLDCLRRTISQEGPRALYKGASPPAVGWAASDSVLLGSLHNYRLWFEKLEARNRGEKVGEEGKDGKQARLSIFGHTMAGMMAGWTVCTVITPIEGLKAKLQMQTIGPKLYSGPIDCASQIVRSQGVFGLWRGFGATILFRSWFGVMFGSYEVMMRGFRAVPEGSRWKVSDGTATFLAGGMGSNFFWIGSFPFDAVKNRLMTDDIKNPRYPTWMSAARQIWSEGGIRYVLLSFYPSLALTYLSKRAD
ncbi:mitochondrial carrier protein [Pseudohyphozyma bogoriensis]|nr:mitochondrial carrier protein [Pseudohyphozyma bogoriensis]